MPRTVVPAPRAIPTAGGAAGGAPPDGTGNKDGLPEKLVKYVPAETLAFFVPISAAIGSSEEGTLIALIAIAAIGTPLYLWVAALKAPAGEKPRFYFYILAEIALACWLLGTSGPTQTLVGVSATLGGVILAAAAFLVPVTDEVIAQVTK